MIDKYRQYAMRMVAKTPNEKGEKEEKVVMKLRGMTLDKKSGEKLTFEKFKEMIVNYGETRPIEFDSIRLGPDKTSRVFTKHAKKKYKPVQTKGLISKKERYKVYPFGFVGE